MGAQGDALAARLEAVSAELTRLIEACDEERWRRTTTAEGWSVGVTAHHVARSYAPILAMVQSVAEGRGFPPINPEGLDQRNAEHAREFENCTRQETLELLRGSHAAAAAALRGYSDDQLATSALSPVAGRGEMSAAQVVELILLGHPQQHLGSIRAT